MELNISDCKHEWNDCLKVFLPFFNNFLVGFRPSLGCRHISKPTTTLGSRTGVVGMVGGWWEVGEGGGYVACQI